MARGDSATSLAPGFRFHPTDEELVRYYLKRKVTNKPFRFDPIAVVDIYKTEPWDLPGLIVYLISRFTILACLFNMYNCLFLEKKICDFLSSV